MSKAKLFSRPGCPHCDQLIVPSEGVTVIDVSAPEYVETGFVPNQVPMLQFADVVLVGAPHIQAFFDSAKLVK